MTPTLYPAICAVKDRLDVLHETFVKSNRLALMWAMPFGVGLTLFADDLVAFGSAPSVVGRRRPAPDLGVTAAIGQSGCTGVRTTGHGETRPLAVASVGTAIGFMVTALPLLFLFD